MKIYNPTGFSSNLTGSFSGSVKGIFDGSFTSAATTEISGAFDSVSSSLSSRVADQESFSSSLDNSFATDSDLNLVSSSVDSLNAATSSYALINQISGSTTSLSSSLASELLKNTTDTLTGDLTVTGTLTAQDLHVQEVTSSIVFSSGSNKFGALATDTQKFTGSLQVSGSIDLEDNVKLNIGTGNDLQIYHDGSNSYINENGTGLLKILTNGLEVKNPADNGYMAFFGATGAAELYFNTAKKLSTTSGGVLVTGDVNLTGTAIYKNSGTLEVKAETVSIKGVTTNENLAGFTENGAVDLYYNNSKKFETTSTGVKLSGTAPGDSIIRQDSTVSGTNWEIGERAAGKWQIFEDDADSIVATFMSTGNVGIGTTSPDGKLQITAASSTTSNGNDASFKLYLTNTDTTNNNYSLINFTDSDGGASSGGMGLQYTDHTNDYGDLCFITRGSNGYGERMRIDSSGNVGIGTDDPDVKLHVYNGDSGATTVGGASDELILENDTDCGLTIRSGTSSDGVISFADSGDHNIGQVFYSHGSNSMTFRTNDSNAVIIDSSQNVGIGTTPFPANLTPQTVLDIGNAASVWGYQNYAYLIANAYYNSGWLYKNSAPAGVLQIAGDELSFRQAASGTANAGIALTQPFTIKPSGNVGIGTILPGRTLTVAGDVSGDANNLLLSNENDTNGDSASIGFSMLSNNTYVKSGIFFKRTATQGRGDLIFATNNEVNGNNVTLSDARMTINPDGDISIGSTSQTQTNLTVIGANSGTNPAATAHMASALTLYNGQATNGSFSGIDFNNGNNSVDSRIVGIHTHHTNRYGEIGFLTHDGTSLNEVVRIDRLGKVGIGTTVPNEKLEVTGNFKLNGTFVQEGTGNNLTYKHRTPNSNSHSGGNALCKFGRLYWTPAHWVTGAPVIKVTLHCKYYQGERREYIIKAGYGDTNPIINELQPSSTGQKIGLLVGTTTSAGYNYAGQPVYYADLQWVQSAYIWGWAQVESQVGFLTSNPTSGWGGVVIDSTLSQNNNAGAFTNYTSFFPGRILLPGLDGKTQVHPDVSYRTSDGELFYQTSSERYKTNIVNLENCLDKVNSLRTVRFTGKDDNEPGFGLIAEETANVIPEVVFKKEIEGFDEPQIEGISYTSLVPFLIKSIQELKAEIEILKNT